MNAIRIRYCEVKPTMKRTLQACSLDLFSWAEPVVGLHYRFRLSTPFGEKQDGWLRKYAADLF